MYEKLAAISAFLLAVRAQQACSLTAENHPSLTWQQCTSSGCTNKQGSIVIDANWRWTHSISGSNNCYTGNTWDSSICTDDESCAAKCCVDGADYAGTYGITTSGNALTLKFVTQSQQKNIGSRTYLLSSDKEYEGFTLLGNEFTFDVDVSNLPCGLNGALYLVAMDVDGGVSKYPTNKAGAKYGTGYCDSQCPRDLKFINGMANVEGWSGSASDPNSGVGGHGSCCSEMDIWEANSISNAVTPHPCKTVGQSMCNGDSCGGTYSSDRYGGTCDPDGCDWNAYRLGNETFFGPGSNFRINTKQSFTVTTKFHETNGKLASIERVYSQNGVTIQQPNAENIPGFSGNTITSEYCAAEAATFGGTSFEDKGGLDQMSLALANPMVLVLSLWDDHAVNMLWLDSNYPTDSTDPGAARGSCSTSSGAPTDVESNSPNSQVVYSNIRFGPIGSTTGGSSNPGQPSNPGNPTSTTKPASTPTPTPTKPASGATQTHWGQCGGQGYSGPSVCESPYTCQSLNPYYSQCL